MCFLEFLYKQVILTVYSYHIGFQKQNDHEEKKVFTNKDFVSLMQDIPQLPLERKNNDFSVDLYNCLQSYLRIIKLYYSSSIPQDLINYVDIIKNHILKAVDSFHKGFQVDAFNEMETCLVKDSFNGKRLIDQPVDLFYKDPQNNLSVSLYRVRKTDNKITERREMFHVPAELRGNISTCRYSLDGFPSLYLSTSIRLARIESDIANAYASRFRFARKEQEHEMTQIKVIDLGLRPKDFVGEVEDREKKEDLDFQIRYILWYPIIAACSFIRSQQFSKNFASEYIIPQLIMQILRKNSEVKDVVGIRYFSCKAYRASELGYNYAFPVSDFNLQLPYNTSSDTPNCYSYCEKLANSFKLTNPINITALSDEEAENELQKEQLSFLYPAYTFPVAKKEYQQ